MAALTNGKAEGEEEVGSRKPRRTDGRTRSQGRTDAKCDAAEAEVRSSKEGDAADTSIKFGPASTGVTAVSVIKQGERRTDGSSMPHGE